MAPTAPDQPLTDAQVQREACFCCGERLDPRTAMEVGQRMAWWDGRWVSALPLRHRGCGQ